MFCKIWAYSSENATTARRGWLELPRVTLTPAADTLYSVSRTAGVTATLDPAVVVVGVSTSRLAIAVHPADDIPGGELGGAGRKLGCKAAFSATPCGNVPG